MVTRLAEGSDKNDNLIARKTFVPLWPDRWDPWKMYGYSGNDTLQGGPKDDTLDGGVGFDTMIGGHGHDTYYVDNTLDRITEIHGQGYDKLFTSISYNLTNNTAIERVTLLENSSARNIYGNDSYNALNGNAYDNSLYGRGSRDTIAGYGGNDRLFGESGDDLLIGGNGKDSLDGGTGADQFLFNNVFEGIDTIKDFNYYEGDKVMIAGGFGATSASQFRYDPFDGELSYNGTVFAELENPIGDFFVSRDIQFV